MFLHFGWRSAAAFVLLFGTNSIVAADAPATGDLWQVTSKMSMAGMPGMPARVVQACTAKDWANPPSGNDQQRRCKRSNFQMTGDTATWTERCENPPMTGHGKITRQGDTFTGSIKFDSAQGNLTISLDGRRVGDCDNPS